MRAKPLLAWLPLAVIAACSLLMAMISTKGRCWGIPWLCHERSAVHDMATMTAAVLLPIVVVIGWGLVSAARQLIRTRQALRHLLSLPRSPLTPALRALARELDIESRLDIVACVSAEAYCYGFVRPRICVTTGLLSVLSTSEVEAVLRHERHHLRRRDPLRSLLWTILNDACWWSPQAAEEARIQRELAADRSVIAAGGRQPLASALLKLLTHSHRSSQSPLSRAGVHAVSGLSVTDARIDQLLQPEPAPPPGMCIPRRLVLPTLTVTAMLLCTFLMART